MTDLPSAAGADLARQALARARASAKTAPAPKTRGPKRTRRSHGGGRDPQALAGILGALTADEGWKDNLGGGSILDRWTELCPTAYTDTTRPTGFDPDTGTLSVKAVSHTVASHLRLMERQLIGYINGKLGRPLVRRVRVSVGGDTTVPAADTPAVPVQREAVAPVRTRETASPGYRATLAAALDHRPEQRHTDPYLAAALERQEAALRANRQPEPAEDLDQLPARQVDRSEAVRRAALARKRQEQVGGDTPRRLFGAA
jgi:predicted nucleic acid-binding Zn ribbon protein